MDSTQIAEVYEQAASASLGPLASHASGNLLAEVVLASSAHTVDSECIAALRKALSALGWADEEAAVVCEAAALAPAELRLVLETLDPLVMVALDEEALYALEETASGRRLIDASGFAAALASPEAKRAAWERLKATAKRRK